ncbi:MAG TPA: NADH-quinone oxidoreductase subunit L [Edaphocola sp.]|nr:NADH-quinone oxidoreductase subunit L [Edaphocola sp.]
MTQLVYLVPLFPLIGFLLNGLFYKSMPKKLSGVLASFMVLLSFVIALVIFFEVRSGNQQATTVLLFEFISVGKFQLPFAFQVDELSSMFMLIITGVGFLIHVYSIGYMQDDEGYNRYFSFMNLFVFSMLLLVLGANYLIMYLGWEGVGLASYLLIGFWFKNNDYTNASKKSFIMNRIGDLGFLIAMLLMTLNFGTLTYGELFPQLVGGLGSTTDLGNTISPYLTNAIALCLFIGATAKSAQIPLYTWLPDAMAGPTPVSALIHAATMVTAGVYLVARTNPIYNLAPSAQTVVAVVGLATLLVSATIAMKQNDIKKVLAYSTVSQLGYMFLALGVGAYVGGLFHVMTHAFFKALLFLGSGSVIHAMSGEQDMTKMGGLGKKMPITKITFLIGCLAIAGIPGFSGFFSKDEIMAAVFAKNKLMYVLALVGAAMTAFYIFRAYFMTFSGSFRGTSDQNKHLHESPSVMTIPLIVLAALSIVGGFIGLPHVLSKHHLLAEYLSPVVKNLPGLHLEDSMEWILIGIASAVAIIMFFVAKASSIKNSYAEPKGIASFFANKWYIDELYDKIIVQPLYKLSSGVNKYFEKIVVDGGSNGIGNFVLWSAGRIRNFQNGQVGIYLFSMVIGIILILAAGMALLLWS